MIDRPISTCVQGRISNESRKTNIAIITVTLIMTLLMIHKAQTWNREAAVSVKGLRNNQLPFSRTNKTPKHKMLLLQDIIYCHSLEKSHLIFWTCEQKWNNREFNSVGYRLVHTNREVLLVELMLVLWRRGAKKKKRSWKQENDYKLQYVSEQNKMLFWSH